MKPYRIAVLGCSATKRHGSAPAKDLYTGPVFVLARAYAELVADRFFILSAKHGLVAADRELGPYDAKLDSRSIDGWSRLVSNRLALELSGVPDEQVLFLAGAQYFEPLVVSGKARWARPLKGLGIGTQKATLKRLIEEATPRTLAELVLAADAKLEPVLPGESIGEVCVAAAEWDRIVRAAREGAA